MKNLNGNNATIEHERPVEGVSTIELWIVEDPKNDKSNIYETYKKAYENKKPVILVEYPERYSE